MKRLWIWTLVLSFSGPSLLLSQAAPPPGEPEPGKGAEKPVEKKPEAEGPAPVPTPAGEPGKGAEPPAEPEKGPEIPAGPGRLRVPEIPILGYDPDSLDRVPGAAEKIDAERLKRERPISVQHALSRLPGLFTVDTDGLGLRPRISMRGLNQDMSKKVLLLEDGAPVALGPFVDPASYYSPSVEKMRGVEVLKGSGTIRNGPNTIGGTINFLTKDPPEKPEFSITAQGGSYGYRSGLVEWGGTFGNTGILVHLLRKAGEGNRANNAFDVSDLMLKMAFALSPNHQLGVKFSYFSNENQATYLGITQDMYDFDFPDRRANLTPDDFLEVQRYALDVNHEAQLSGRMALKTLVYANQAQRDWWRATVKRKYLDPLKAEFVEEKKITLDDPYALHVTLPEDKNTSGRLRTFRVAGVDQRLVLNYKTGSVDNETELGWRFHTEQMENIRIDNTQIASGRSGTIRDHDIRKAHGLAGFAQNRFAFGQKFEIIPGVRYEGYRQKRNMLRNNNVDPNVASVRLRDRPETYAGQSLTGSNKTWNDETIPGLGLRYTFTDLLTVFAGAHKGFAPPRVEDVVSGTGKAEQLEAERSVNSELGIRGKSKRIQYSITGFQYDFTNQIVSATQSGGAAVTGSTNAGRTMHQGVEMGLGIRPAESLLLEANWTRLGVARVASDRIPMADLAIDARTPPHVFENYYRERLERQHYRFLPAEHKNQKGNRLPYTPRDMVNLGVTLLAGKFESNVQMQYISEQFADFENTREAGWKENIRRMWLNEFIPESKYRYTFVSDGRRGILRARDVWNFNTAYKFTDSFQIFASVQNVFDKKYIASRAPEGIFPGLYRYYSAGARATF